MKIGLTEGVYANMKFPDREFKEFPKKITVAGGKRVLVHNVREEITAIAEHGAAPSTNKREDADISERNALMQELARMQSELAAANVKLAEKHGADIVSQTTGAAKPAAAKPIPPALTAKPPVEVVPVATPTPETKV